MAEKRMAGGKKEEAEILVGYDHYFTAHGEMYCDSLSSSGHLPSKVSFAGYRSSHSYGLDRFVARFYLAILQLKSHPIDLPHPPGELIATGTILPSLRE